MAKSKRHERMSDSHRPELADLDDIVEGAIDDDATALPDEVDPTSALAAYWFALIGEKPAAEYLGLVDRTMQKYRQKGGGPPFVRISSRSIKYRRIDLRRWSEDRLRSSTSDVDS